MNPQLQLRAFGQLDPGALLDTQRWRSDATAWTSAIPTRIPLSEVRRWDTSASSEAYVHDSGRFFSVVGIESASEQRTQWTADAMIEQPEVGLLGLLVTPSSLGMAALVQAKAEPGTIGGTQLSPTVQATRSNQLRAHGGKPVFLLDLFRAPRGAILDTIQSEHGGVFWQKRNRSVILEVPRFEAPPGFRWVEIVDLFALLSVDNLVHADLRTVLSMGPFWPGPDSPDRHSALERIQQWLSEHRASNSLAIRRVPLFRLDSWHRTHDAFERLDQRGHEIIGVRVRAHGREVEAWDQLMVHPRGRGLVGLAIRERRGELQALVRICVEPGLLQFVEIGPTVQIAGGARPADDMQRELARLLAPGIDSRASAQVYFDGVQTDEGGRFFRSEVRYVVVACDIEIPSDRYRWCDIGALTTLARYGNQLNMQARDALVCLLSSIAVRQGTIGFTGA